MHSILNLAQLLENGSWVWYISFPRDKRPTQPMLSLSPSVGISSPVSYLVHAPLCCFNVCQYGHWLMDLSSVGGKGVFHCGTTRVCMAYCPALADWRDQWAMEYWHPLLNLFCLCVSEALLHAPFDCVMFPRATDMKVRCVEDFYSWWLAQWWTLLSSL